MRDLGDRIMAISTKVRILVEKVKLLSEDNKFLKEENNRLKEELLELKKLDSTDQEAHSPDDHSQAVIEIKEELQGYVAEIDSCIKLLETP